MGKYYVVADETGGVITAHYKNAILFAELMDGWDVIREFSDFEAAEGFLLDHLSGIVPRGCLLPERLELNQIVTICGLILERMS